MVVSSDGRIMGPSHGVRLGVPTGQAPKAKGCGDTHVIHTMTYSEPPIRLRKWPLIKASSFIEEKTMKTIFRSAKEGATYLLAPITARPLLARSLQLLLVLCAYGAGVLLVERVSGDARVPVILFAVYFLPAVLRSWLLFYWCVRDEVKALMANHRHTAS